MAWTNSWNKCHAPSPKWSLLLGIRRFIVVSKRLVTEIAYDRVYHIRDDNQKSMFEQPFQSLPEKLRPYLTAPKNLIIGGWRWLLSVGGPKNCLLTERTTLVEPSLLHSWFFSPAEQPSPGRKRATSMHVAPRSPRVCFRIQPRLIPARVPIGNFPSSVNTHILPMKHNCPIERKKTVK